MGMAAAGRFSPLRPRGISRTACGPHATISPPLEFTNTVRCSFKPPSPARRSIGLATTLVVRGRFIFAGEALSRLSGNHPRKVSLPACANTHVGDEWFHGLPGDTSGICRARIGRAGAGASVKGWSAASRSLTRGDCLRPYRSVSRIGSLLESRHYVWEGRRQPWVEPNVCLRRSRMAHKYRPLSHNWPQRDLRRTIGD
jgi:hypothetical protein